MAPRTSSTPSRNGKKSRTPDTVRSALPGSPRPAPRHHLTAAREAELAREAESLGDVLLLLPGDLAPHVAWLSRLQRAAQRDAADLLRAPFAGDDPPLTRDEIRGFRDKIELLRLAQSRWQATQRGPRRAATSVEQPANEAGQHRRTLLRFFDLRFRSDPEGQRRVSLIRARGDAELIQGVSELLALCAEHGDALQQAPRGEADAAARLGALAPLLSRLVDDRTLSAEARRARRLRDAAYALAMRAERRVRAAAEYWYGDSDKMKDYEYLRAFTAAGDDARAELDQGKEAERGARGSVDIYAGYCADADAPPA
ncbi:ATPase [Sorangium sp. So ce119]|uniref:ATPase n=1 Tax=Sorangium sp. So ce119 TaxID=3133279 RepID=UPI003F62A788